MNIDGFKENDHMPQSNGLENKKCENTKNYTHI